MGVKPAQGELNMALQPLFANIPQAHLIHDDLIEATTTHAECNQAIEAVKHHITRRYHPKPGQVHVLSTRNQILGPA